MNQDPIHLLNSIAQLIYDKKGFNILALDVRGISTMTDFFIIAEGTSDRHTRALAQYVMESLSGLGETPMHKEGDKVGDWVVLDYSEVVIHLFMPGLREKYALETLWREGKIVDVTINVSQKTI